jgi:hypothetical protein
VVRIRLCGSGAFAILYIDPKAAARFPEYVDAMVDVPEARIGSEHATLRGL